MEARHRCVVCDAFAVEIHHIVPFSENRVHEYHNLVALCPNCHSLADDGKIDRPALRQHKARAVFSVAHKVFDLLLDPLELFNPEYGPDTRTDEQRDALALDLEGRGMLAGIISTVRWPLVRCEFCESIVSVDRSWTPQDNCLFSPGDRLDVYCEFGCAKHYQDMMRPIFAEDATRIGEYLLQNTVQIVERAPPNAQGDIVRSPP